MKWQVVKSRPLHRLGHRPNRCSKQHIAIVPDAEIMLRCKVQRDRSTGLRGTRVSAAKSQYADQWSGPLPLTDNTPRAAPRWSLPVADLSRPPELHKGAPLLRWTLQANPASECCAGKSPRMGSIPAVSSLAMRWSPAARASQTISGSIGARQLQRDLSTAAGLRAGGTRGCI